MRAFALSIVAAALSGTALAGTAVAQTTGEPQAAADTTELQDIIVTAERRSTNLQDTPLSILAVTQTEITAKGIEDLEDLSKFSPNLSISPTRGSGNNAANFVIRGIAGGGGATGERGVGLYVDGVYVPRTSGAILRVLDVDRVEVLRGPQGTLFGRNSTGGAIRIFSKQPTSKTEAYIRGTIGNMDRRDIVGMVNLPLGDTFAIRAQGAYLDQDGYVKRGTEKLGAQKDVIGRVVAKWEPISAFRVTTGLLYSDSKANGSPMVFREFDMNPGVEGVIQGNYADWLNDSFKLAGQQPIAPYNDNRIVRGKYQATDICLLDDFNPDYDPLCNQYNDNKYVQADVNIGADLSENVSLTSITGYAKLTHKGISDWQVLGTEQRRDDINSKVLYHETQLNSKLFKGALDLVVGINYFNEIADAPNVVITRRGTSVFPTAAQQALSTFNINSAQFAVGNADAGLFRTADTYTRQESDSWGIFGSATWHVTDKLNVTGGLRQAWDYKDYLQTRWRTDLAGGRTGLTNLAAPVNVTDFTTAPGTTSTTVRKGKTFKALDWRGTVDYHFDRDIMVYATASKAYKAGTFSYTIASWTAANNATGDAQSATIQPIPNEKVINYEIGARLTLFNRRLRVNPTLFMMDYTNRQAAVQVQCTTLGIPASQCPVGFVIQVQNQGDVRLKGFEIDGQLQVTRFLTLDAGGAITDPKLKNPPAGTVNLFPDVPSPTFNIGATLTLNPSFGRVVLNGNYAFTGKQATHPSAVGDSAYTLPAYGLLGARLTLKPSGLPLTISAFVNNLLDNSYATYAQRFGGGYWDAGAVSPLSAPTRSALADVRGRPREFGLTLQYDF
jgi:iron complex outermembrane receptor protein